MQPFDCIIIELNLTAWDTEWVLATWCYGPDYNYKWSDADYLGKKGLVIELKKGPCECEFELRYQVGDKEMPERLCFKAMRY